MKVIPHASSLGMGLNTIAVKMVTGLILLNVGSVAFASSHQPVTGKNEPVTTRNARKKPDSPSTKEVPDFKTLQVEHAKRANFLNEEVSQETRKLADWIIHSADNQKRPFVIIDKRHAKVFVFYANGDMRAAAPALLGQTIGDDSSPGVGNKPLRNVTAEEKTTPAGRFLAALDKNLSGEEIVWIDYDSAVSLHAVVKGTPQERRAERLASTDPLERRISFGCVNVPVDFFKTVVSPTFNSTDAFIYVAPEVRTTQQVFTAYYDVDEREKIAILKSLASPPSTAKVPPSSQLLIK